MQSAGGAGGGAGESAGTGAREGAGAGADAGAGMGAEAEIGAGAGAEAEVAQAKIWNPAFAGIFIANALMYMGQWMIQTMITKYASTIGASVALLGIVASAYACTSILFKLVSGPAIDSLDVKKVLFAALLVVAAAYFGFSISASAGAIVCFRLLQGAGQAFTATCCLALAADALPQDKMGAGISIFALASSVSQAIAPSVGLAIAGRFGYGAAFRVAACMVAASAAIALSIKTGRPPRKKTFRISLGSVIAREALLPGFLLMLLLCAFTLINSYLVIYAGERGCDAHIGLYFTVYAGSLLLTRPLVGALSDRIGFMKTTVPALCCFALSFFIVSGAANIQTFCLAAFVAAFGYGACQPVINAL
ncbi:MAG: MFS transporter, partial [Clostridiales bacterium]|nr:MFS transporter [Clostridiales bacterium]